MSPVTRPDPVAGKRMTTAALFFAAAMIGLGGSLAWVIATAEGGRSEGWAAMFVGIFLLALFASVVNVFVAYGKMMWFYRCPKCRKRAERVEPRTDAPVRYLCRGCNVQWDTGWSATSGGD